MYRFMWIARTLRLSKALLPSLNLRFEGTVRLSVTSQSRVHLVGSPQGTSLKPGLHRMFPVLLTMSPSSHCKQRGNFSRVLVLGTLSGSSEVPGEIAQHLLIHIFQAWQGPHHLPRLRVFTVRCNPGSALHLPVENSIHHTMITAKNEATVDMHMEEVEGNILASEQVNLMSTISLFTRTASRCLHLVCTRRAESKTSPLDLTQHARLRKVKLASVTELQACLREPHLASADGGLRHRGPEPKSGHSPMQCRLDASDNSPLPRALHR